MIKAYLVFRKFHNSFKVTVTNLEDLSVEQIKKLQDFVYLRNGIFDFETYSFTIQKKIEFKEFVELIQFCNIPAICEESISITKEDPRIGFGQYKGMKYNELPDSYILWLKSNYNGYEKEHIKKELLKRAI